MTLGLKCLVAFALVGIFIHNVVTEDIKDWKDENQDVVHLETTNWDEFMKNNPSVLLMIYKKGCRHCTKMKPIYAEAAKAINVEKQAPGKLAAIDCLASEELCKKLGIYDFDTPTAKYFENGSMAYDYHGKKRLAGIVKFMKDPHAPKSRSLGPPWHEVNQDVIHLTGKELKKFIKKDTEKALIFFHAPWCGHCEKFKPAYGEAAKYVNNAKGEDLGKMAAIDCVVEENKGICERYGVNHFPTLLYFKNGKQTITYEGKRDKESVIEFMEDPDEYVEETKVQKKKEAGYDVPWEDEDKIVVHLTDKTFDSYVETNSHVLAFFYAPWCGHCKKAKPQYSEAAKIINKEVDGTRKMAAIDCTKNSVVCEKNKIDGYPTILMFQNGKELEIYGEGRTSADILKYLDKFKLKTEAKVTLEKAEAMETKEEL